MQNLFDMTGKVVLITGGSRGLGRAMVQGFAEAGADVAIVSRKLAACEKAAREVEKLGVRAFPYACHVAHWDELEPMVAQLKAACEAEGRDVDSVEITSMWIPATGVETVDRFRDLGVQRLIVPLPALGAGNPVKALDKFADEVMSKLA